MLLSVLVAYLHADLIVLEYSGTAHSFVPSEVRRITFEQGRMCVLTHQGETYKLPVSEVRKCYFGIVPDSSTSILTTKSGNLLVVGNYLHVETSAKKVLTVVNAEGKTVLTKHLSVGNTSVSLETLSGGVYVVTIGGETLKFLKR